MKTNDGFNLTFINISYKKIPLESFIRKLRHVVESFGKFVSTLLLKSGKFMKQVSTIISCIYKNLKI